MQLVTGWAELSTGLLVSIDRAVLERIAAFRQTTIGSCEAGGLLLGFRRGLHIDIHWHTEPQNSDIRRRYGFFRGKAGHEDIALKVWTETKGKADYVGEWHTHSEAHPTPSSTDVTEWLQLSASRRDAYPFIGLIGGTEGFAVFLCQSGCVIALTAIEFA